MSTTALAYTNVLSVENGTIVSKPAKITAQMAHALEKKKLPCDTLYTAPRRDDKGVDFAGRMSLCVSNTGVPFFRNMGTQSTSYGRRARAIADALGEPVLAPPPPRPKPFPDPATALAPAQPTLPLPVNNYDGVVQALDRLTTTIAVEIASQNAWRKAMLEHMQVCAKALASLTPPTDPTNPE